MLIYPCTKDGAHYVLNFAEFVKLKKEALVTQFTNASVDIFCGGRLRATPWKSLMRWTLFFGFLLFFQFRQNGKTDTEGCNTCHDYCTTDCQYQNCCILSYSNMNYAPSAFSNPISLRMSGTYSCLNSIFWFSNSNIVWAFLSHFFLLSYCEKERKESQIDVETNVLSI